MFFSLNLLFPIKSNDPREIRELLTKTNVIAVLGIKTEAQAHQPALYVPKYLDSVGFEVVPVPIYYPEVTHILGHPVYRTLADIPFDVDLINVFRRPEAIPAHLKDLLSKKPKTVWMQSGISHPSVAQALAEAGIQVVQDRCLMIEHQRWTQANN